MSADESFVFGSGGNHNVVPYDYGDKKADSRKVPKFNGDPKSSPGGKPTSIVMSWA